MSSSPETFLGMQHCQERLMCDTCTFGLVIGGGGFLLRNAARGQFPLEVTVCVALPWLLKLGGCAVPGAPGLGVTLSTEMIVLLSYRSWLWNWK